MKTVKLRALIALLAASAALLAAAGGGLATRAHADPGHGETTHPARKGMTVKATTRPAPGGVLVRLKTRKFRWAPEHLSPIHGEGRVIAGEGHGHIYLDGAEMPATMVVSAWTYLRLQPGRHTLRVTLNANDHNEYARDGHSIQDTVKVTVPEPPETEG